MRNHFKSARGVFNEDNWEKFGWAVWHPRATGMGAVDNAAITLVGAKVFGWLFGRIGSLWSGRASNKIVELTSGTNG